MKTLADLKKTLIEPFQVFTFLLALLGGGVGIIMIIGHFYPSTSNPEMQLILKEQKALMLYMNKELIIADCKVVGEFGNMKGYVYFCPDGSLRLRLK